ncbi:MAG TPA: NRDE family protein [Chitinophagales bacterium]|nr:NRDE family protein [Chitinophagales bacterium]
MCTVSFVPLANQHFILTSNRDETVARGLASAPVIIEKEKYQLVCPVDPLASGTWIAASNFGDVVCLLNGAFKKHKHQPPYRKSRGLVVMDYFDVGDPKKFSSEYDLTGIEPFTMVMGHRKNSLQLFELRWDGNQKYFIQLDENDFHLWSSATLYNDEIADGKKKQFKTQLDAEKEISPEKLIGIHQHFLYEDWVKPPERVQVVSTLSITSVSQTVEKLEMNYCDLVRKEMAVEKMMMELSVN